MRAILAFVMFLVVACTGCGAASSPANAPRAATRAAVDVAKDAWVIVGTSCVDAAKIAKNDQIRVKCAHYLLPARDLISYAAEAVDTQWSPKAACALSQGVLLVADGAKDLVTYSKTIQPLVDDAVALANVMVGSAACVPVDAGPPPAPPAAVAPRTDPPTFNVGADAPDAAVVAALAPDAPAGAE